MKFTKMQGCGNDYVYMDATKTIPQNPSELSIRVSDRHYGIGSDGLILICASDVADFRMMMFNADGSESEMCGNGIRCFGKYVYDHGLTEKKELAIETLAGIRRLQLLEKEGEIREVTVDMGKPILSPEWIPVNTSMLLINRTVNQEQSRNVATKENALDKILDYPLQVGEETYRISCASMGNPHATVYVEDTEKIDIETIGPLFENHSFFPKRVNTEFVQILDREHIRMRVFERGSGETFACGTGACACAYVSMLNGLVASKVEVEMLGGTVTIRYDKTDGHIYMTGPAVTTFEGEFFE